MAVNSYTSSDGTAKVQIDTTAGEVTIIDLDITPNDSYLTAIDASGAEELDAMIVPGFKNGKIMMKIARLIEEALT